MKAENQESEHVSVPGEKSAWAKWRGKWQACIQCSVDDCPVSTVKAMPTYKKKTYVTVYFPAFQVYTWVDIQTLRGIEENLEPFSSVCREDARQSVRDFDAPKTQMLQRLASSICDISDRLPIKAVIEQAQDANVWKAFAKEAMQAKSYGDVGRLLIRLSTMVVKKYLKISWLDNGFNTWKDTCESAATAACIENMIQELTNAIMWEEVERLWDEPDQFTVGPEWKDWKVVHAMSCPSSKEPPKGDVPQIFSFKEASPEFNAEDEIGQFKMRGKLSRKRKEPPSFVDQTCSLRKKLGSLDYNSMTKGFDKGLFEDSRFAWYGARVLISPSKTDIVAAASFVCCGLQLVNCLDHKHKAIPSKLFKWIMNTCKKENKSFEWMKDGFVCPRGCKSLLNSDNSSFALTGLAARSRTEIVEGHFAASQSEELCMSSEGNVLKAKEAVRQVLHIDISLGQEALPIPCVVDEESVKPCSCSICNGRKFSEAENIYPWETFSYITKRVLNNSLGIETKESQLGCSCKGTKCSSKSCDHVQLFDLDNPDACDIKGQPMKGRFPYNHRKEIILQEGYLVYECNSSCHCKEGCTNRVLQKGVQLKLEVFKTRHKGWAVRTGQKILRGTSVCEYLGEVLNDAEANKRGEGYDRAGCSYLYDIDVHLDTTVSRECMKPFVIDATKYGNVSRFMNHSCAPNLINYQVLVESMDCQLAHIGLYANRDIELGEELAYDYRYKLLPGKGFPCHCGAPSCRGRLY